VCEALVCSLEAKFQVSSQVDLKSDSHKSVTYQDCLKGSIQVLQGYLHTLFDECGDACTFNTIAKLNILRNVLEDDRDMMLWVLKGCRYLQKHNHIAQVISKA
jgi:hypothetical protein